MLRLSAVVVLGCSSTSVSAPVEVAPTPAPHARYACVSRYTDATPDDSDGDGVPDSMDACPCQPGANMPDDTDKVRGCPWDVPPRPSPSEHTWIIDLRDS